MRRLLTALALSLALVVPVAGSAAAATGGCLVGPAGVPQKAYDVAAYVRSHNGAPPAGYVGGTTFQNREGNLDPGYGPFKEYDVNRHITGVNRGPERIVLGPTHAASFYTGDHYTTFITMYGDSCTTP
jgi:ribonuclease T1